MRRRADGARGWILFCAALALSALVALPASATSDARLVSVTVDVNPGVTLLRITSSGPVRPSLEQTADRQVALLVPDLRTDGMEGELPLADGGIERVELIPLDDGGARMEIELERPWETRLVRGADGLSYAVEFLTETRPAAPPAPPAVVGRPARVEATLSAPPPALADAAPPAVVAAAAALAPPDAGAAATNTAAAADGTLRGAPPPVAPPLNAAAALAAVEVREEEQATEVVVRTTAGVPVFSHTLHGEQPRFYIDLSDTVLGELDLPEDLTGPGILGVRAGEHPGEPPSTRVVVDLVPGAVAELDPDEQAGVYRIQITPPGVLPTRPGGADLGIVVALDAGHGGADPGSIGPTGLMEKEVTLDITLRLGALLQELGFTVLLSRDQDTTLGPPERAAWLSAVQADLLVSIHCDSMPGRPELTGTTTYYRAGRAGSAALAEVVQGALVAALGLPDRGARLDTTIYNSGFYVLRASPRPSVLVETAFLSHRETERRFRDPEFRQQIAQGIAAGVLQYVLAGGNERARR